MYVSDCCGVLRADVVCMYRYCVSNGKFICGADVPILLTNQRTSCHTNTHCYKTSIKTMGGVGKRKPFGSIQMAYIILSTVRINICGNIIAAQFPIPNSKTYS